MMKFISLVLIVLFLSACDKEKKILPSGNIVKIGILAPLSGASKRLGGQSFLGIKAANEMHKYLNNGDEIVFEVVDTKSDIQSVREAFNELLLLDVKLIFSFMDSTHMVAMKEDFEKSKKFIITTLATDSNLVVDNGYISQVCIDNSIQVLVTSHYVRDELFIKDVGIVYDSTSSYSLTIAEDFQEYYTSIDGDVKFFLDISKDTGLEELKEIDKENISLLFNTTDANFTTSILKTLQKKDRNFKILGTDGLFSEALGLKKEDLDLFDGIYVLEHYAHSKDRSEKRKTLESILDKDGIKGSSFAYLAYDGYQLLLNSLNNCPGYNKKCIHSLLQNSDIIEGISDNFSMSNAKVTRAVYIDKIENAILNKEVVIN